MYFPGICLEGQRITTKSLRIPGLRAETSTPDLPNMKQSFNHSTTKFGEATETVNV
jgi:hypothetical protein